MASLVNMKKSFKIEIQTDRFDLSSGNTGIDNGLYGNDFIKFIGEKLSISPISVHNEDWGWGIQQIKNNIIVTYAIRNYGPEYLQHFGPVPDGYNANWCIVISAERKSKIMGLIPWNVEIDTPSEVGSGLLTILSDEKIKICSSGME